MKNNIEMITKQFKICDNGNYKLVKTSKKNVSNEFFTSINDRQVAWSFRRSGGGEWSYKGKTEDGYETLKKISISPNKQWRIIRFFTLR